MFIYYKFHEIYLTKQIIKDHKCLNSTKWDKRKNKQCSYLTMKSKANYKRKI